MAKSGENPVIGHIPAMVITQQRGADGDGMGWGEEKPIILWVAKRESIVLVFNTKNMLA
jgi:hypothetical protein